MEINNTEGKGYAKYRHREIGQFKQETERERIGKNFLTWSKSLLSKMRFIFQVKMWLVGKELTDHKGNSYTDPEGDHKF